MDDYYLAEIRLFAGNYEPRNWMFCDGRTLSINQNAALFTLLGTNYGGDGRTTFKLPDLRGRVPVGAGQGPGLTSCQLGEVAGQEAVQLTIAQIPAHQHSVAAGSDATSSDPADLVYAEAGAANAYESRSSALAAAAENAVTDAGADQPHENVQPCLGLNYIICVHGIYPRRN